MAATIQNDDYIAEACRNAKAFWDSYHKLRNMQDQWNALDYGNTLKDGASTLVDGITAAEVGAVVFDAMNAVKTVLDAGNATNISRLL